MGGQAARSSSMCGWRSITAQLQQGASFGERLLTLQGRASDPWRRDGALAVGGAVPQAREEISAVRALIRVAWRLEGVMVHSGSCCDEARSELGGLPAGFEGCRTAAVGG